MTRPLLCLAAALAACSSEPQPSASGPTPEPSPGPTEGPAAATATPTADRDSGATPRAGELKTFGDWTVGCDNTKRCELRSLIADGADLDGAVVSIAREAGPDGRISLGASSQAEDSLTARVEGAESATTPAALVSAMANGRRMIARAAGRALTVSLKGASAALRYTDAEQGRAGTVTALVAKGPRPASTVPAPSAAPVIVAVAPSGEATTPPAATLAAMRKAAQCDDQPDAPEFHALGGGKTLVLLPCSSGAYNVLQALFVLDGGTFKPATSDAPVGFAETGADSRSPVPTAVNGEWKDGVLASYAKGRGIGDCGVMQELVWDGTRFRLSRQRAMGECRGNPDYITTWRATVIRR